MRSAAGLWTPRRMSPQQGGGGFQRPGDACQTHTQGTAVVTGAHCDPGGRRSTASFFCCAREEEREKKKEEEEVRKHQNCRQQGPSCTKGTSGPACPSSQCCLWPQRARRDLPETRTALPPGPPAHGSLEEDLQSLLSCWDRLAKAQIKNTCWPCIRNSWGVFFSGGFGTIGGNTQCGRFM